jgi:hypothetical protein
MKSEELIIKWLKKQKDYVNYDCGVDFVCLDGYFDLIDFVNFIIKNQAKQ